MAGQGKAIHLERAVGLLVDIKMALIPRWREVIRPDCWLVEQVSGAAAEERKNDVGIVTGVDLIIRNVIDVGRIVTKRAEVAIERAILLQHHDDVLDSLQATVGNNIYRGRSRGCVALRGRGCDGVSGVRRRRNSDAAAWAADRWNALIDANRSCARGCPRQS